MRLVAIALYLSITSPVALADLPPDPIDLQAAYCLGVSRASLELLDEISRRPASPAHRQQVVAIAQGYKENAERLARYLAGRMQFVDPQGLLLASDQATADAAKVIADTASPDIRARTARCKDTSFLPY